MSLEDDLLTRTPGLRELLTGLSYLLPVVSILAIAAAAGRCADPVVGAAGRSEVPMLAVDDRASSADPTRLAAPHGGPIDSATGMQ